MAESLSDLTRLARDPVIMAASLTSNVLGLALPVAIIQVYDRIIPRAGYQTLAALTGLLVAAALADFAVRTARSRLMAAAGTRFERAAYAMAFDNLLRPGSEAAGQGTLHDRLASIDLVRAHNSSEMAAAILDLPFIVLFVAAIALISPLMGLAICGIAAGSVAIMWLQRRGILRLNAERRARDRRRHAFLVETLRGIETVKSLGVEAQMQRRYEKLMRVNAGITRDLSDRVSFTHGTTAAIGLLSPALMSCVGAWLVLDASMTVGAVAAIVLLTGRVIQPLLRIEALFAGGRDLVQARENVTQLTARLPTQGAAVAQIERLAFAEDGADEPIVLQRGDCIAVEAPAAEQARLMRLLSGQPVRSGALWVDGRAAEDCDPADLTRRIAWLRSDYTMLDGTLEENLTGFDPACRDAAIGLARALGIDRFISHHPDGLGMSLAARKANGLPKSVHDAIFLVAGLAHGPDVVLFDAANAGLDHETDRRMIEVLRDLCPRAIVVLVTRRPSYRMLATRVLQWTEGGWRLGPEIAGRRQAG